MSRKHGHRRRFTPVFDGGAPASGTSPSLDIVRREDSGAFIFRRLRPVGKGLDGELARLVTQWWSGVKGGVEGSTTLDKNTGKMTKVVPAPALP